MQGMMKRFRNWMMETGALLSEPQPKTAEAEKRSSSAYLGFPDMDLRPTDHIAPSDRKIGGKPAGERISWFNPDGTKRDIPVYANGDTPVDRALRDLDETRRPTLADLNSIRIALAQRVKVEETRRSRSANVMRRASDMLGYLSRELIAQDRRLFEAKAERDSFEAALNAQAETSAKLSTMYGAGHENTEADAVERDAFLNCPACRGSGHIADVDQFDVTKPRTPRQDALLGIDVLERYANGLGPVTTADARRIANRFRDYLNVVSDLTIELENANRKIVELSQPRIVNVAGLVDADLAERYDSLRASFAKVSTYSDDTLKDCEDAILDVLRDIGSGDLLRPHGDDGPRKRGVIAETVLRKAGLRSRIEPLPMAVPALTYGETERNAAINAVAKHGARIEASGLWANVDEIVDLTARTLGMRRAGA